MIPDSLESQRRKEQHDRRASIHEPPPVGEGYVVLDSAVAVVNKYAIRAIGKGDPYSERRYLLVVGALKVRAEFGKEKYGTYLRTNNGRDALVDLYQELLDAIMYAEQCRMEILFGLDKNVSEPPARRLLVGAETLDALIDLAAQVAGQIESAQ